MRKIKSGKIKVMLHLVAMFMFMFLFSFEFPALEVPHSKFKKAAISKCFLPVLYPIIDNPRYTDMIKIYWREVLSYVLLYINSKCYLPNE